MSAEWQAVCRALWDAALMNLTHVKVCSDSQLVVKQFNGKYATRDPQCAWHLKLAKMLARRFEECKVVFVERELNRRADELANVGFKEGYDQDVF